MILSRGQHARIDAGAAEAFAAKLAKRFAPAQRLLRQSAAAAFKQRAFKMSARLTEEAGALAT